MNSKLPFRKLKKNLVASAVEKAILDSFNKDERYHYIKKSVPELKSLSIPVAYKKISKVLYANEIEPPISKQGHESSTVLGSTGEALTELILPPREELPVNNRGYDLDHDNALIEIKATVAESVALSNVQYYTAQYLVIHVYEKFSDKHRFAYLIPLKILRAIKGRKLGNVSINLFKENWVDFFKVTFVRLSQFFQVRRMYLDGNYNSLVKYRYRSLLDREVVSRGVYVTSLFNHYEKCGSWKWERRYAYYEYYHNSIHWHYQYNSLSNVYNLGLYAVYHDNRWKRRVVR
ncbi:hypothetical protein [Vibrio cholerae]|uniref:hypothetical protein n=2 Tax=Vibrio cholerae TaxID=666 RepID=UPI00226E4399|nr:hypothetical protein [Vibrio cholerae]MCX9480303.1 hypothetical protein [Vibrio cholerae]